MIKLITYLLIGQNPSAPQRRHLKGHQLATTATPCWRDPQGPRKHPRALHVTSRCICMSSLSCEREKDERGKALFANVERGVGIFLQNCHSFLSTRRI